MTFNDAVFGVSITILGAGLGGLLLVAEYKLWGATLSVVGVTGIVYSVLKRPSGPMVEPIRYGRATGELREGIFAVVREGPAYEVQIAPVILLGEWVLSFEQISRLDGEGFLPAETSRGGETSLELDFTWRRLFECAGLPTSFPLIIKYRDATGQWYQTDCELRRDTSGFNVKFIRQQRIRKQWWRRKA